jgi:methylated-DNA-[protein]-cysteine S-methyltransferase
MKSTPRNAKSAQSSPLWEETLSTPLCPVWLSFSGQGLEALYFNRPGQQPGPLWPVKQHQSDPELAARLRQWRQEAAAALEAYFAGDPRSFDHLALDLQGTPFQIKVWQALRQVPFGNVTSYQALAEAVNLPRSARAVGGAMRANPLPIIIPCHRVIAANGSLGGYSGGLQYKRLLLSHEQVAMGKGPIPLYGPIDES